MSQDFINDLPVELLHQVFDCLFSKEREIAAAVCTRWSDIISGGTYADKLTLSPYHLNRYDVDALKRYRSISILIYGGNISRLQQLLNNEEVMSNVEELNITFDYFRWEHLFSSGKELRFPELRKITFDGLQDSDAMHISRCKIVAPRLKVLQLISSTPMWLLNEQIETLVIDKSRSLVLPNSELFPNIRSLTLKEVDQVTINDSFKTIVHRLKELQLLNMDYLNFREVFANVRDIESLSISGKRLMSAEVYALINNMSKLKQLSLLIPIDRSAIGLSLTCLEKLTMYYRVLIPLENVPNLRSLCIDASKFRYVDDEKMLDYYRLFGHQLNHLTLIKLSLNEDDVSMICSFNNLQTLKMFQVKVEFATIEDIFQHISNLKLFRLQSCIVISESVVFDYDSDYEHDTCWGDSPPRERIEPRFSNLQAQYADCAIAFDGTILTQKAIHY